MLHIDTKKEMEQTGAMDQSLQFQKKIPQEKFKEYLTTIKSVAVCSTKIIDALRINYRMLFPGNVKFEETLGELQIMPPTEEHDSSNGPVKTTSMTKLMNTKKTNMEQAYILLNKLRCQCLVSIKQYPIIEKARLNTLEEYAIHEYCVKSKNNRAKDNRKEQYGYCGNFREREEEEEEEESYLSLSWEENSYVADDEDDPIHYIIFETGIPISDVGITKIRVSLCMVVKLLGTPEDFKRKILRSNGKSVIPYPDNWNHIKQKAYEKYKKIYERLSNKNHSKKRDAKIK